MTQTFWLEPTGDVAIGLRRYFHDGDGFTCETGYHSSLVYTGVEEAQLDERGVLPARKSNLPHDSPAWPTHCEKCYLELPPETKFQHWQERLYRRTDNAELRVLHKTAPAPFAPAAEEGACWDAVWRHDLEVGPDGITLMVRCPGGHDWNVDSRASNCGLPDNGEHQCWVRHGDPRECRVTVDKNGNTCNAGAGSIQTPNWHGFLRGGVLA